MSSSLSPSLSITQFRGHETMTKDMEEDARQVEAYSNVKEALSIANDKGKGNPLSAALLSSPMLSDAYYHHQ
jgi:hypothetical protein